MPIFPGASFNAGSIMADLGLDTDPFIRSMKEARDYALEQTRDPIVQKLEADGSEAIAETAATVAAMKAMMDDASRASVGGVGTGVGRGGVGSLLPAMFAGDGGGGNGGLAAGLGFGSAAAGGIRIPGLRGLGLGAGLAGFGTLGSFAGLGVESALTTGVGLLGSAAGAAVGAGALGLGAAGVLGVGMGTDLAGIGQAAGDIKSVSTAMDTLNKQIAVYGAGSTQAATAQAQLNYTLQGFSPVAQQAVVAAAATSNQFKQMFDFATGQAEKTGAQIIQQVMQVGEKFLPTIGKYAAENMQIIQTGLQPLFAWMQGPGLSIFQDLEQMFQSRLPTAVHAGSQALELLIRVIDFLAPYTGKLVDAFDKWITLLNGADFSKLTGGLNTAIGVFRTWWGLIKAVGTAIYELFHHDAGTGTAIVGTLTQMIDKFNAWIQTAQGGEAVRRMLEAHKKELLDILSLLPQLISLFGQMHLFASPALMELVGFLAQIAHWLLETPLVGQMLNFVLAFEILGRHMSFLSPFLNAFNGFITKLAKEGLLLLGSALTNAGGGLATLGGWFTKLGTTAPTEIETLTASVDGLTASLDAATGSAGALDAALAGAGAEGEAGAFSGLLGPKGERLLKTGTAGTAETAAETAAGAGAGAAEVAGGAGGAAATAGEVGLWTGAGALGVAGIAIAGAAAAAGLGYLIHQSVTHPGAGGIGGAATSGPEMTIAQARAQEARLPPGLGGARGADPTGLYLGTGIMPYGYRQTRTGQVAPGPELTPISPLAANVSLLAGATGLAQGAVKGLANELGVNLKKALSPDQVAAFTKYVKDNGGAATITGGLWTQAAQKIQNSTTIMLNTAAKNMSGIPTAAQKMVVQTQPHLVTLVANLNKAGHEGAASFISSFVSQIPKAELASKSMHDKMHSPLLPLVDELRALGETSAANMVQKFIDQQPKANKASKDLHDNLKNPLYSLETELAATGNTSAANMVQGFINHHPEAQTQAGLMHDAITGQLAPLEAELYMTGNTSAANLVAGLNSHQGDLHTAGFNLGYAVDEGLALGIDSGTNLANTAVDRVAAAVKARAGGGLLAKSPSLWFMQLGKDLMLGLQMGIDQNAYLATGATDRLVRGVQTSAGGLGAGSTGSVNGPLFHIENVHFQNQTDMKAFFNMADFYMQQGRLGVA